LLKLLLYCIAFEKKSYLCTIMYDFDKHIDRRGTNCIKYDQLAQRFGRDDLLPLWVADMDFETPDFIINAINNRCQHPVLGYSFPSDVYYGSIIDWLNKLHRWRVKRDWITFIPGIVRGIAYAVQCFTEKNDKIIIQPPVYHPFRLVPEGLGREVLFNPLKMNKHGLYEMDFDNLEDVIDEHCKLLILSSPHNPAGIVWDKETLQRVAALCCKHNIIVISDEIHSEMTFPGFQHHPFPTVSDEAAACGITFMAPSKTFNIAGIVASYAVVPDIQLRNRFYRFLQAGEFNEGSLFSYEATIAAYSHGFEWKQEMIDYVIKNVHFTDDFFKNNYSQIKVYMPQASFLVWLDCRDLRYEQKDVRQLFIEHSHLALNDGIIFGSGGSGFMRMNVGCPRSTLKTAFDGFLKF